VGNADRRNTRGQNHGLDHILDRTLIAESEAALAEGQAVRIATAVTNVDRSVGTMLGYELTRRHGGDGLPDDTISIDLHGSAGNSFGTFVPRGITLRLTGDANDYVGKGLSGGRIAIRPPADSSFVAEEQIIAGNVLLYGATAGEAFIRGRVGERFCVRNSGATAVVEGIGDHGCEYMTGGRAVIIGPTGRNFAAGMSGGIAFVHDPDGVFPDRVNREMVLIEAPDGDDRSWLRDLLVRHQAETGSAVAERLLSNWESEAGHFVKVMPTDYKRVLEAAAAARASGRDEVAAIMASTGA
jgi:glutamate synthase (NADPH/NADH) large chain